MLLGDISSTNGLEQADALIHFYFKEEPDSAERFALLWNRLKFSLEFKGEISTQEINIG